MANRRKAKGSEIALACSSSLSFGRLWLDAGKQSIWRAREAEHIGQNAILQPRGYRLRMMQVFGSFFQMHLQ